MRTTYDTNRYREVKKLGTGGFSTVYLVKDLHNDNYVALKDIKAVKMNKKNITRLQDEFLILNSLKHKNLVEVYDIEFNSQTQSVYYTMEYCKKTNIIKFLRHKSESDILQALVQALRALYFIHSHDIIHFDIKPENFGIVEENNSFTVKLLDFGLFLPKSQIKPSSIRGTLQYMAPELFTRAEKDQRLDIYSLGMVFLKLLMLKNNIKKRDKYFDYSKLTQEEIGSIKEQNLLKIIKKMVHLKPDERFSDAYKVLENINLIYRKNFRIIPKEEKATLFFEPKFTGRVNELNYLKVLLMTSSGEKANSTFMQIKGESGIGKTRLMKEFQIHSQLSGFRVKESFCIPDNPFMSIPVQLIKKLMPSDNEGIFDHYDKEKQAFFEEILMDQNPNTMVGIEDKIRHADIHENVFYNIVQLFDYLIQKIEKKPIVLFIHDLHLIDEMSLKFLQLFCHKSSDIIWVMSVRTDFDSPEYIEDFLSELSQIKNSENIFLKALSSEETKELLVESFPINRFEDKFYHYMFEKTAGNPLLITELIKTLIEMDILSVYHGKWLYEKEIFSMKETSGKLEDILFYRVNVLKGLELFLAKFAAVLNSPVNIDFIKKYFQGTCDFESALTAMMEKRIMHEQEGYYLLSHEAQKDAIIQMIDEDEFHEISLDIAYLNETLCTYPHEVTARLFFEGGHREKALHYFRKALEHYQSVYRNEKILEISTMLLSLETDELKKKECLETIIRINLVNGRLSRVRKYLREYRQFPDSISKKKHISLFESILLDREGRISESREKLFDFFTANSKHLKSFEDLFEIYLNLGKLFLKEGDINNAELYLNLAEGFIKNRKLDFKLVAKLKQKIGFLHYYSGKLDEAENYWKKSYNIYRDNDYLPGISTIIANLGMVDLKKGDIKKAVTKFSRSVDMQSNVGNYIQTVVSSCLHSKTLREMGKYSESLDIIVKCEEYVELIKDVWTRIFLLIEKASLLIEMGAYVEAENALLVAGITSSETGYRRVQAKIDFLNSLLLFKRGQLQDSYRMIKNVIETYRDISGDDDLAGANLLKTRILINGGKKEKAISILKETERHIDNFNSSSNAIDFYILWSEVAIHSKKGMKDIENILIKAVDISSKAFMLPRHIQAVYAFQKFQIDFKGDMNKTSLISDLEKILKKQCKLIPEEYLERFKNIESNSRIYQFIKAWGKHG